MGMYDMVHAQCRECGGDLEWQSKAGRCVLADYPHTKVPPEIAHDLDGATTRCPDCGKLHTIRRLNRVIAEVMLVE